jgi:hypothetical protein
MGAILCRIFSLHPHSGDPLLARSKWQSGTQAVPPNDSSMADKSIGRGDGDDRMRIAYT